MPEGEEILAVCQNIYEQCLLIQSSSGLTWGNFFKDFLPNFTSTVLGAVAGVPFGLWLNRIIVKRGEEKKQVEQRERLKAALETVEYALILNNGHLRELKDALEKGSLVFGLQIDTSTWEAVKFELIQLLHEPDIQRQIAYQFSKLGTFIKVNEHYLNFTVGVGAAMGGSDKIRDHLKSNLIGKAIELIGDSERIIQMIDSQVRLIMGKMPVKGKPALKC